MRDGVKGKERISQDYLPDQSQLPFPSPFTAVMPIIRGFLETSFIDWPERLCSVIFLGGCNFRCPFCHNHPLVLSPEGFEAIPLEEVLERLTPLKRWLGGICVSGGEPTLSPGLPHLLTRLKVEGWAVKLDTNGSRPEIVDQLLQDRLVDMVSMDVKAPLDQERYDRCAGVKVPLARIRQSISLIKESGIDHEFRMTVLPRFHAVEDIIEWAQALGPDSRLKLQNFNPRTTLNPDLQEERGFSPEKFAGLRQLISQG